MTQEALKLALEALEEINKLSIAIEAKLKELNS